MREEYKGLDQSNHRAIVKPAPQGLKRGLTTGRLSKNIEERQSFGGGSATTSVSGHTAGSLPGTPRGRVGGYGGVGDTTVEFLEGGGGKHVKSTSRSPRRVRKETECFTRGERKDSSAHAPHELS